MYYYGEDEKNKREPDRYIVMEAKWLFYKDDKYFVGRFLSAVHDSSYNLYFIIVTSDASISEEEVNAVLKNDKGLGRNVENILYKFVRYEDSKVEAIREAVKDLPKDDIYLVFDEENLYDDFHGRMVLFDVDDRYNCVKRLSRYLQFGYWWDTDYRRRSLNDTTYGIRDNFENVIFLDIDGVLNKDRIGETELVNEGFVQNLAMVVEATKAEIVLISSWKRGLSDRLKNGYRSYNGKPDPACILMNLLSKYGLVIADQTPSFNLGTDARPTEIRAWLTYRLGVLNFVILDDDDWDWNWLTPHVIKTSVRILEPEDWSNIYEKGLKKEYAERAIEILQMNKKKERY